MTFKVGDRVRAVIDGDEGFVQDINLLNGFIGVEFEGDGYVRMAESELSLVDRPLKNFEGDEARLMKAETSSFEENVRRHTDKIASLLIAKNKQYSNSALDPIRVFSKSDRMEQLRVRADDKLSRIRNGDTSEDAITDLCGYLILMKIAEESE